MDSVTLQVRFLQAKNLRRLTSAFIRWILPAC